MNKSITEILKSKLGKQLYTDFLRTPQHHTFEQFINLPIELQLFTINSTLMFRYGYIITVINMEDYRFLSLVRLITYLPFESPIYKFDIILQDNVRSEMDLDMVILKYIKVIIGLVDLDVIG